MDFNLVVRTTQNCHYLNVNPNLGDGFKILLRQQAKLQGVREKIFFPSDLLEAIKGTYKKAVDVKKTIF